MRSYYSIFGSINFFHDLEGTKRGLRKRPVATKLFVIEGAIMLWLEGTRLSVNAGEEWDIQANRWHGIESIADTKYLQKLEGFDEKLEERKEWL